MQDAKREILQRVATGEITAEEAALELEGLERPAEPAARELPPPAAGGAARVRIRSALGSVTVLGDESVQEAVADGPHTARRIGDVLEIETDDSGTFEGFRFSGRLGLGIGGRAVTVRMNPRLPLDADVQAGSLRVNGVRGPIAAQVQMGSTRIEGFTEAIDLDVQAGSVQASGRLTSGSSRVRCQAGKVAVVLDPQSSVKITAKTSLGRIALPATPVYAGIGDGNASAQVGDGASTLEVSSEMGSVSVEVGR